MESKSGGGYGMAAGERVKCEVRFLYLGAKSLFGTKRQMDVLERMAEGAGKGWGQPSPCQSWSREGGS